MKQGPCVEAALTMPRSPGPIFRPIGRVRRAGRVDCARVRLDHVPASTLARLHRFLTADEAARADAFRNVADRDRAVAGRAALRILLARATGCSDPGLLPIQTGEFGKPLPVAGPNFNVAHAGTIILFGFSRDGPVGVDVEPLESGHAREVVPRLHPIERAEITAAADPAQAFVRLWTRKEAVAKAVGFGLSVDPELWAVSMGPRGVVVPPPGIDHGAIWSIFDVVPVSGYAGAVAVQGIVTPRCWNFPRRKAEPLWGAAAEIAGSKCGYAGATGCQQRREGPNRGHDEPPHCPAHGIFRPRSSGHCRPPGHRPTGGAGSGGHRAN